MAEAKKKTRFLNVYCCGNCGEDWESEDDGVYISRCPRCGLSNRPRTSVAIKEHTE